MSPKPHGPKPLSLAGWRPGERCSEPLSPAASRELAPSTRAGAGWKCPSWNSGGLSSSPAFRLGLWDPSCTRSVPQDPPSQSSPLTQSLPASFSQNTCFLFLVFLSGRPTLTLFLPLPTSGVVTWAPQCFGLAGVLLPSSCPFPNSFPQDPAGSAMMWARGGWPFPPPPEAGAPSRPSPPLQMGGEGLPPPCLDRASPSSLRWEIESMSLVMTGLITAHCTAGLFALEMGTGRGGSSTQLHSHDQKD